MGCGTSLQSVESPDQQLQAGQRANAAVPDDDGGQCKACISHATVSEHTLLGRCSCGRLHKRDYLASKFGNPYLASSRANGDFTFSHCPLPRLSQPAAALVATATTKKLADGEILPPPNRSIAGSASANWLDLPARWQQQQSLALPPSGTRSADELRADVVNTWATKR